MTTINSPLPEFVSPPVVEVALSVQFDPLAGLRTPQMGLLWQEFRDEFPVTREQPPLEPAFERFGVLARPGGSPRFQFLSAPPPARCWFLNKSETELVQVQQDRFVRNWRKGDGPDEYPRYRRVREQFAAALGQFNAFLAREQVGQLTPNQCELTYVNHIVAGCEWSTPGQLGQVLTLFSARYSEPFLPEPEDCRLSARYIIPSQDGEPLGRLHVSAEPARRKSDDTAMIALTLTGRGRPLGGGVDGVLGFLDLAHEWIVRGFASVTTDAMHLAWRRKR